VAGEPEVGDRPRPDHHDFDRHLFLGARDVFLLARAVVLACGAGDRGVGNDGDDGVEQHGDSDDCGRGEARPGDELLHHGLSGHGAVRQFVRGIPLGALRCAAHGSSEWSSVLRRRDLVQPGAARDSPRREAYLYKDGHPAGGRNRAADGVEFDGAA